MPDDVIELPWWVALWRWLRPYRRGYTPTEHALAVDNERLRALVKIKDGEVDRLDLECRRLRIEVDAARTEIQLLSEINERDRQRVQAETVAFLNAQERRPSGM